MWAKIWAHMDRFTVKTVIFSAYLLVQAQTIPQNVHQELFIWSKVEVIQGYQILKRVKVLRYGFFTILKYVKTPKKVFKKILIFLRRDFILCSFLRFFVGMSLRNIFWIWVVIFTKRFKNWKKWCQKQKNTKKTGS